MMTAYPAGDVEEPNSRLHEPATLMLDVTREYEDRGDHNGSPPCPDSNSAEVECALRCSTDHGKETIGEVQAFVRLEEAHDALQNAPDNFLDDDIVAEIDTTECNSSCVSPLPSQLVDTRCSQNHEEESALEKAKETYQVYTEQQDLVPSDSPSGIDAPSLHNSPIIHRREVSRETLRCYRETVTADHFIYYSDFENLMATNQFRTLAMEVSKFTQDQAQRGGDALGDGCVYQGFIRHCTEMLYAELSKTTRSSGVQPLTSSSGADEWSEAKIIGEGIEKFVTTKLYSSFFNVIKEDHRKGRYLSTRLSQLQHLTAEDLDALPEVERHHTWSQAMFELEAMRFFKSPREKLFCAIRAARLIQEGIRYAISKKRMDDTAPASLFSSGQSNRTANVTFGADELLPCWMLLVLRAAPTLFYENVMYIDRFRSAALCTFEESYTLANLESAVEFWLHCNDDGKITEHRKSFSCSDDFDAQVRHPMGNTPLETRNTDKANAGALDDPTALFSRSIGTRDSFVQHGSRRASQNDRAHEKAKLFASSTISNEQPPLRHAPQNQSNSNTNTMEDVRRWLVDERKTFEMLTVSELRTIVETTRQLFH